MKGKQTIILDATEIKLLHLNVTCVILSIICDIDNDIRERPYKKNNNNNNKIIKIVSLCLSIAREYDVISLFLTNHSQY